MKYQQCTWYDVQSVYIFESVFFLKAIAKYLLQTVYSKSLSGCFYSAVNKN